METVTGAALTFRVLVASVLSAKFPDGPLVYAAVIVYVRAALPPGRVKVAAR
jgi:hypothetical protein